MRFGGKSLHGQRKGGDGGCTVLITGRWMNFSRRCRLWFSTPLLCATLSRRRSRSYGIWRRRWPVEVTQQPVPQVVPARATGPQALGAPAGAKLPRLTITTAGLVFLHRACRLLIGALRRSGPCGGRPLRRLRATPPLSGEARPKSRLRRLAVGLLAQPFGGTIYGRACAKNSGVWVRLEPMAVCRLPHSQT